MNLGDTMEYLKEVSIKDIKDLVELNVKTWKESYKKVLSPLFLKLLEKNKDMLIKEEEERFIDDKLDGTRKYLFKINDVSVGYLVISRCGIEEYNGLGEINALYLVNKIKNKSYGTMLFNRALKELKSMGFTEVIIGVIKELPSNDFFLKRGATFIKENKRYIMDMEVTENLYLYSLLGD